MNPLALARSVVATCALVCIACVGPPTSDSAAALGAAQKGTALEDAPLEESVVDVAPLTPPATRGYVAVAIAPRALDLAAQVAGTLVDVGAGIGDEVSPGETLARVAVPTLPADLGVARAALAQARADEVERGLLVRAARRRLARQRQLRAAGANAPSAVEDAALAFERERATATRLRAVSAGRRAELLRLELQRSAGRIETSFSGRVVTWYRAEGAVVAPGDRIVRVASGGGLWVRFAVPVTDLDEVDVGAPIDVLPEQGGEALRGVVRHVAPELDLASQQMLVEAELQAPLHMVPGQACRVRLRGRGVTEP